MRHSHYFLKILLKILFKCIFSQKIYGSIGSMQSSTNLLSFTSLNQPVATATSANTNEFSPSSSSSASSTSSASSSTSGSKNTLSRSSVSPSSSSSLNLKLETAVEKSLYSCLREIHAEHYFRHFIDSGFDDPLTIAKITPSDLTAIGIKDPNERNRLKTQLTAYFTQQLQQTPSESFEYVITIEDFLKHIHLEQYLPCIRTHFTTLGDFMQNLNLEDLEEIGLKKLGHQKKIMLTLKRFKCASPAQPQPIATTTTTSHFKKENAENISK